MKRIFLLIIVYCLLFTPVFAQKATDYELLAPIPLSGVDQGDTEKATAKTYIEGIFTLIIAIAGGLAVLKIIFGGIQYMSTDAFQGKSEAKSTIQNAIWGLLLAIGAWLILFTINEDLVNFNLNIPVQEIPTPSQPAPGGGGPPMTQEQIQADTAIRNRLTVNVIAVPNGPCTQGQTIGCTNVVGLPNSAIDGLISLRGSCLCDVVITGGTEGGHATHGVGQPIVDLRPNTKLNSFLGVTSPSEGQAITKTIGGKRLSFKYETAGGNPNQSSTGAHWHVIIY